MDILIGILALLVGLSFCLSGLRLFLILLPVWGFAIGFLVGAAAVTAIFGDGFLSTTLGVVVGLVVAIIFAIFSYLYWYVGALLAAGIAGGVFGAALFSSFGVDSEWLLLTIALVFGAAFVFAALRINFPVYVVIVNTAISGSAIALGGLLLVLNRIDRNEIGTGTLWQRIDDHWILWLLWVAASIIGVLVQSFRLEERERQIEKWGRLQPRLTV